MTVYYCKINQMVPPTAAFDYPSYGNWHAVIDLAIDLSSIPVHMAHWKQLCSATRPAIQIPCSTSGVH
jgi:hypothetical protein